MDAAGERLLRVEAEGSVVARARWRAGARWTAAALAALALLALGSALSLTDPLGGDYVDGNEAAALSDLPPSARFAYLTFHGDGRHHSPRPTKGKNSVYRYDLFNPGAEPEVPFRVLNRDSSPDPPRMLRTMAHGPDGSLLVAQGFKFDSAVLQFSHCDGEGIRSFVREYRSPMMVHPYGVATVGDTLCATSQALGSIICFNMTAAANSVTDKTLWMNASLFDFNSERAQERGLAEHKGCLYVADLEHLGGVYQLCQEHDEQSFLVEGPRHSARRLLDIKKPIGIVVDKSRDVLLVSTKGRHEVIAYDMNDWKIVQTFSHKHMKHPTGMAVVGTHLFVLSQTKHSLLLFNLTTGDFVRRVLSKRDMPDKPEGLLLSSC